MLPLSQTFKEISCFFFPIKCLHCQLISKDYICKHCEKYLEEFEPECFVTRKQSDNWEISKKHKNSLPIEKVYYFYKYNLLIHKLMISIKYSFHKDKISEIMRLLFMSKEFQKVFHEEKFNLITYVPVSRKREIWRGFNQTKLIAEELAKSLKVPYCRILEKSRDTKAQIDLNRKDRLKNLENAFILRKHISIRLTDQKILLIDDICTTGSTLIECSKTIKKVYPEIKVYGMCLARGRIS